MSGPRKRRENHNEIEKKRRDLQRLRLEELRQQIPKLASDRPSAVTIISEATSYVRELQMRVTQLDTFIHNAGLTSPAQQPLFISAPSEPHTMPGDALFSFLQANNQPSFTNTLVANSGSTDSSPKKILPSKDGLLEIAPRPGNHHHITRRDSSLLLPTNDPNTFLFGKRDSMQNLFSGSIPFIFEDAHASEVNCRVCLRGVENLIMIDCDSCHNWFHIRCVGIESNVIPLQWKCSSCLDETSLHFP